MVLRVRMVIPPILAAETDDGFSLQHWRLSLFLNWFRPVLNRPRRLSTEVRFRNTNTQIEGSRTSVRKISWTFQDRGRRAPPLRSRSKTERENWQWGNLYVCSKAFAGVVLCLLQLLQNPFYI